MYPKELIIVIEQDTMNYWRVYLNGICSMKFLSKVNAEQYIEDVKTLNQSKKITVLTGEEVSLNPSDWLPTS